MEKDTLVKVANRGSGKVFYKLDELRVKRDFAPNEIKEVPFNELQVLQYSRGGQALLRENLIILDNEALDALIPDGVEPEYYYTEEDIKDMLLNGSLDEFLDMLDFAPKGVIDNVKKLAVIVKLNDVDKRKAILDKTGFDVSKAIMIADETSEEATDNTTRTRRVSKTETPEKTRRVTTSKYKVTSIGEKQQ